MLYHIPDQIWARVANLSFSRTIPFLPGILNELCIALFWSILRSYLTSYFQKFTDAHDLYLHHRNIYDSIIHQRIAKIPLDLGSIIFLVFIASPLLDRHSFGWIFINYFSPVEGRTLENYAALSFSSVDLYEARQLSSASFDLLLGEFLTDPNRAGKYVLDGSKYALVARFLLDCFLQPCPEQAFLRQVVSRHKLSFEYWHN